MPEDTPDVRCFQLTIFLSTDNPLVGQTLYVAAGDNRDEVVGQPPRFQTSPMMSVRTVCSQLLRKLARAVDDGSETVRIRVRDGIIIPDPDPRGEALRKVDAEASLTSTPAKSPVPEAPPEAGRGHGPKKRPGRGRKPKG